MTDPPEFFDHGGEKLKKTVPIPVAFKDPSPKVALQDLTPSWFARRDLLPKHFEKIKDILRSLRMPVPLELVMCTHLKIYRK
jgi:hypothetical protein